MVCPILVWEAADVLKVEKKPPFWMTQTFFLYAGQLLVNTLASKLYIMAFGRTGVLSASLAHIVIPITMLVLLLIPMYIIQRRLPKIYWILSGARG